MMSAQADLRNVASSAGKLASADIHDHTVAIPPMPDYNGRIIAYTATAAIIVAGILQAYFSNGYCGLWPAHLPGRTSPIC